MLFHDNFLIKLKIFRNYFELFYLRRVDIYEDKRTALNRVRVGWP